jgi:PAS domain-containing protein
LRAAAIGEWTRRQKEDASAHRLDELLHELQVHKIELEIQDESLRQAQNALEASRDRYVDLYEFSPAGHFTLKLDRIIAEINPTGCKIVGSDRMNLSKKRYIRFVRGEGEWWWVRFFSSVISGEGRGRIEFDCARQNIGHIDAGNIKREKAAKLCEERISLTNISERKQREKRIAQSEKRIAAIIDSVDSQITVLDQNGLAVATNEAWRRFVREDNPEPGIPAENRVRR